jgi:hypothetical protein
MHKKKLLMTSYAYLSMNSHLAEATALLTTLNQLE